MNDKLLVNIGGCAMLVMAFQALMWVLSWVSPAQGNFLVFAFATVVLVLALGFGAICDRLDAQHNED